MKQSKELFKDIPGYEGKYQISSAGRVKSLVRWNRTQERFLNIQGKNNTRRRAHLYKEGEYYCAYVDELVAVAFVAPMKAGEEVICIDGDLGNMSFLNLKWVRQSRSIKSNKRIKQKKINLKLLRLEDHTDQVDFWAEDLSIEEVMESIKYSQRAFGSSSRSAQECRIDRMYYAGFSLPEIIISFDPSGLISK